MSELTAAEQTAIDQHLIDSDLLRLTKLLQTHDWTYSYSDDHTVWRRGVNQENDIMLLRASLLARGIPTQKLYDYYAGRL